MGMLFNTDTTVEILKMVNKAFDKDGLHRIIHDQNHEGTNWSGLFSNMGTGADYTYQKVAIPLGLDFDIGSPVRSLRSMRWKKFLDYLDKTNSDGSLPPTPCATVIGTAIVAAIDAGYPSVEFFALPSDAMSVTYAPWAFGGETTMAITINTLAVDVM